MNDLQAMHKLIERCAKYNIPLCLVFVDYRKALDSVEDPSVLDVIEHLGLDPTYIKILKHIYQNNTSFIRLH